MDSKGGEKTRGGQSVDREEHEAVNESGRKKQSRLSHFYTHRVASTHHKLPAARRRGGYKQEKG